jgi:hypothetical protein
MNKKKRSSSDSVVKKEVVGSKAIVKPTSGSIVADWPPV